MIAKVLVPLLIGWTVGTIVSLTVMAWTSWRDRRLRAWQAQVSLVARRDQAMAAHPACRTVRTTVPRAWVIPHPRTPDHDTDPT